MAGKRYRVIQWATGTVGKVSLKHFIENPEIEVVGVYVTNPEKVGKDAAELVGLSTKTGVLATNEVDKILALDADCVHFAPMLQDIDMVCRLLRSGKNVVSMIGPFYPTDQNRHEVEQIEAACAEGGVSFHGTGIHPGYIGEIMPLTMMRLSDRIDRIEVSEIADKLVSPSVYIEFMGFGQTPEELQAKGSCMDEALDSFAQSIQFLADGLGKKLDGPVTQTHEVALATKDVDYPGGTIKKGTVAGQHWTWTGNVDGKPLFVFHLYYRVGDDLEPAWHLGPSRHHVVITGNPSFEMTLQATEDENGQRPFLGIIWTALLGVTSLPQVVEAKPGYVSHFDLGVVRPRGVVRAV